METKSSDPAYVVCKFIETYGEVWDRYFPNSMRKAHWQIASIVRMHDDGILFSRIRGRLDAVYGLDEETSILRIKELVKEDLISLDEKTIRSSTCLSPTNKLTQSFDAHVAETVQLLYAAAREIEPTFPSHLQISPVEGANRIFFEFFESFLEAWDEHRLAFLRKQIADSPARRNKALLALKTYAYWHIFMTAWLHQHPQSKPKKAYLLVDDFHSAIYQHVGVSVKATTGYIQDMIDWGFLRRLSKDDGVPRGKFAVRMDSDVFENFRTAFASTSDLAREAGRNLMNLYGASSTATSDADKILKFRVSR
ncbi:hypothetical protein EDE08_1317 [Bradyrhizobium sp. R2.2-H]|uniref:hypothetical protein n=1 Tax=unclassified Bradyrhizobium TaxID=2631580 RepID=UPI0010491344|nr:MULTISPECIES: hypothetical protein [unclassified Bradyrhizobium]TCU58363.1 hypothetical protein EDE10_1337 [Bradyrhizobium sp. Y-H1]TCU62998.1 hypothetical protein EDE08_1317 [Bradyrhizobium sp. R2.2-H]